MRLFKCEIEFTFALHVSNAQPVKVTLHGVPSVFDADHLVSCAVQFNTCIKFWILEHFGFGIFLYYECSSYPS